VFRGLQHWLDTFGVPRPLRPQIIPTRWRIPFYIGLSLLSFVVLLLLVIYVLIPGIKANQAGAPVLGSRLDALYVKKGL